MINLENKCMNPNDMAKLRKAAGSSPIATTYAEFLIEWNPLIVQLSPQDQEKFTEDLLNAFKSVVSSMTMEFSQKISEVIKTSRGGMHDS